MPVPKRKRSRARRDSRFANKGMAVQSITECKNCKEPLATHQACKKCGFYKGDKVLNTKADRTVRRTQTRNVKKAAQQSAKPTEVDTNDTK
ncbi:MAG: 50S ribosomal protein L32 [bacterium]|nr:50S ribosomal protein L32 [bacterium]